MYSGHSTTAAAAAAAPASLLFPVPGVAPAASAVERLCRCALRSVAIVVLNSCAS